MANGYRTIRLATKSGVVPILASANLADALDEISDRVSLYDGVRLTQVLEAAYVQGRKDGARAAFDAVEQGVLGARRTIPHRKPGRPRRP